MKYLLIALLSVADLSSYAQQTQSKEDLEEMKKSIEGNIEDLQRQLNQINEQLQKYERPYNYMMDNGKQPVQGEGDRYQNDEPALPFANAGIELQKASNDFVTGLFFEFGGIGVGYLIISSNPDAAATGGAIAGLGGLIGLVLQITAWGHIRKAGEYLENPRMAIGLNKHGIGLAFNISR